MGAYKFDSFMKHCEVQCNDKRQRPQALSLNISHLVHYIFATKNYHNLIDLI